MRRGRKNRVVEPEERAQERKAARGETSGRSGDGHYCRFFLRRRVLAYVGRNQWPSQLWKMFQEGRAFLVDPLKMPPLRKRVNQWRELMNAIN